MFAKTENKSRMRVIAASPRAEVKKTQRWALPVRGHL